MLATQAVCFWRGRIQFLDADYLPAAPAQKPYVLVYWGDNSARFKEVFEQYGVFKPSTDSSTHNRDNNQVLGGNILHSIPPNTHRKHGEGSGNLSWGYANANSKKKKPIKQLYFEWEYGGMRGKTYVRSHLKEEVTALNESKAPVIEILELLTYNPKVKKALGI